MTWKGEWSDTAGGNGLQLRQMDDILNQVEMTLCSASDMPSLDQELLPLPSTLDETDAINSEKEVLAEELRHACCERVALENSCARTSDDVSEEELAVCAEGTKEDYEVVVESLNET